MQDEKKLLNGVNKGAGPDEYVNHLASGLSINIEDDAVLVIKAQSGDCDAFGGLVRRYQNNLFNLAVSLVSSREEAEDLAAEAFTRAWRNIRNFRNESGFKTWLWRILINLSRSHLRRRYLQNKVFFWKKPFVEEDDKNEAEWTDPSPGADPEKSLERENLKKAVSACKAGLSPREREVFTLRYGHDLKISEIGSMLSLSQNTVKVLLFRGAKKMAKELKEYKK